MYSDPGFRVPLTASKESTPLYNSVAEQALLGALILRPRLLDALPGNFAAEHYGYSSHAEIHAAVVACDGSSSSVLPGVMQMLQGTEAGERQYLTELTQAAIAFTPDYIATLAGQITDQWRRRGLLELSDRLRAEAEAGEGVHPSEAIVSRAISDLELLSLSAAQHQGGFLIDEAVQRAITRAEEANRCGGLFGLSTGLPSLDKGLGGMEDGSLYILAARPGMGKTALAAQIALSTAEGGVGVAFVSLEMQASQIGRRVLALVAGIPLHLLKSGAWSQSDADRIVLAQGRLKGVPLTIEDQSGLNMQMIALRAKAAHRKHGLGLIVVDHLHIVAQPGETGRMGATWGVGQVSNALKRLAKSLNVPVLALAQLSRGPEGREDKRPTLADLRQSGEIEQDADAVMMLYRPEYYLSKTEPERLQGETDEKHHTRINEWYAAKDRLRGKAEVILTKIRDGEPGTVHLHFDGARMLFSDAAVSAGSSLWDADGHREEMT